MKWMTVWISVAGLIFGSSAWGQDQRVYLMSKRQMVESNYTLVVFFYDRAVTQLDDCEREIQRGVRGHWRYYSHQFPKPKGYAEKLDYHCVQMPVVVEPWYDRAPYDYIYQIDLRDGRSHIQKMQHYADCLRDLRKSIRDENRFFFCGKLSQTVIL